MVFITVRDLKGQHWCLMPHGHYTRSQKGLVEGWAIVVESPPDVLTGYSNIPLPVFTDWWP